MTIAGINGASEAFWRATEVTEARDAIACVIAALTPFGEDPVLAACRAAVAAGMDEYEIAELAELARVAT